MLQGCKHSLNSIQAEFLSAHNRNGDGTVLPILKSLNPKKPSKTTISEDGKNLMRFSLMKKDGSRMQPTGIATILTVSIWDILG